MLLAAVVGSGIMAERLAGGNVAVALLANTIATGAALIALILTFVPVSGAHLNPTVTLVALASRTIEAGEALLYIAAQVTGAVVGVAAANLMFDLPLFSISTKMRSGFGQLLGEFIATFGLIAVIRVCARVYNTVTVAAGVAAYITAAYWFTSSTSFANPAVTIARSLSDTFAGIRPADIPGFILAQLLGAFTAYFVFRWLMPEAQER